MCLELGLFVLLTLNTIRPSCIQPTLNGTPNWNSKCSLLWFSPTEIELHTISKSLSFSHNQFSSHVEYLKNINESTSQICFKITSDDHFKTFTLVSSLRIQCLKQLFPFGSLACSPILWVWNANCVVLHIHNTDEGQHTFGTSDVEMLPIWYLCQQQMLVKFG